MRFWRLFQVKRRSPTHGIAYVLFWWTFIRTVIRVFLWIFYRFRMEGAEHVPSTGPLIYVANHLSHYDPPAVGSLIYDRPYAAFAQSGLFRFKPFAWAIRQCGSIPVGPGESEMKPIREALGILKGGGCVMVFPEGTRSPDGTMQPFLRGTMVLLKRAKVPVIPIAVEGSYEIWPRERKLPRLRGRLIVRAAAPILPATLLAMKPDDALEHLRRTLETMRLELREDLRRSTKGRFPPPGHMDRPYWENEVADSVE